MDFPPPPKRRRITRTGSALTATMPRIPPPPPMSSHSAPNAVNRNLDEQMPISSPAPTEVAAPLREESVAEGNVHKEAEDRELEPPVAASQDVRSGVFSDGSAKNSYLACFGSFFGVSKTMLSFIDDLCQVVGGQTDVSVSRATSLLEAELFPQYEYPKLCFCSACDSILSSSHALCWNEACEMNEVHPKRSKNVRRTNMHLKRLAPQLEVVLCQNIDVLLSVHHRIHWGQHDEHRPETPDFGQYREDIERPEEYGRRRIKVVLTLNFDGVKMRRLSRTEAWPVYLRLEGLPSDDKNNAENILLPAIMFVAKTPTKRLLRELFSRLKRELEQLSTDGISIMDSSNAVWLCFPKIMNSVMDFSVLAVNYLMVSTKGRRCDKRAARFRPRKFCSRFLDGILSTDATSAPAPCRRLRVLPQ
ncbi:hypothetical protein ANCCAN_05495 [Ancylostoma caninum]|uniref:Uncharacterized protein n=1 Tax=Ancylostoma caninum TaxID=29170 RepID=A0A368GYQ7_ANCCA|nr:hypothetical protein ANCCAN_05495 [Ancylostoma caninum]